MKIATPFKWIIILPACAITYVAIHWLVIIFGKISSFMYRDPWSDQFFQFVLGPGFAGYWSLLFPLKMFTENVAAPKLFLALCMFPTYGAVTGVALFTGSGSIVLAGIVSVLLSSYAYAEEDI